MAFQVNVQTRYVLFISFSFFSSNISTKRNISPHTANLQSDPLAIQSYLFKLGTYKVDQLRQEQSHLADEHRAVVEQTQDLAISNYTTFIQTSECSKRIFCEFSATEQQLDTLIERLPDLQDRCERFVNASADINSARRLNTLTLRRNAQLLEILELPQLMDTCIRHGKYEEALELAAYVQRMGVRHANIPVINVCYITN